MRKPVVDYRQFRLRRLRDPEFSHLLYLLGWVGYFALYFLTENLIPTEKCYVIHSPLDDLIPFCEVFVIPYVGWYLLIVVSLLYFALYNPKSFIKLQSFIIITQVVAMTVYILFPNMQDLRPSEFPRDNIFTDIELHRRGAPPHTPLYRCTENLDIINHTRCTGRITVSLQTHAFHMWIIDNAIRKQQRAGDTADMSAGIAISNGTVGNLQVLQGIFHRHMR